MMKIDSSLRQAKCDKVVQQERELGINEIGELQPYQDERGRGKGRASAMRPTLCKKRSIVMDIISLK